MVTSNRMQVVGCLSIFGSAFLFYLSTLVIRWAEGSVTIDPAYFVFARFLMGFVVVSATMAARRTPLNIVRPHLLVGRAVTNCVAVFCFYKAISFTTVAEANILNMTYPVFVTVFSWSFLKSQRDIASTVTLVVALAGVWLVLASGKIGFSVGNVWGLASGVFAAAAVIYLNVSRQYHDTHTILFFLFGLGSLAIFLFYRDQIFVPGREELYFLLLCAGSGVVGQYLLTLGFRYVTAVEGSIISSTRILLAAVLGPFLAADPPLAATGWIGALLIFGADVYLAVRKAAG